MSSIGIAGVPASGWNGSNSLWLFGLYSASTFPGVPASGWNGSNSLWLFNPKQKHTPHSLIQSSEFLPSGKNQLALMYN